MRSRRAEGQPIWGPVAGRFAAIDSAYGRKLKLHTWSARGRLCGEVIASVTSETPGTVRPSVTACAADQCVLKMASTFRLESFKAGRRIAYV